MADATRSIVIFPPAEVLAEAEKLSALVTTLAGGKNNVVLNHIKRKWPHITLYQFGLPEANVNRVEELVRALLKEQGTLRSFSLVMEGYYPYRGTGIFWKVRRGLRRADAIQRLHESLLWKLNEVREGVVPEQHRNLFASDSGLTSAQRVYLGTLGYPTARDQYIPHITIGDVSDAPGVIQKLPTDPVEFEVKSVHVTEIGPYGICPGSLVEIPLRQ